MCCVYFNLNWYSNEHGKNVIFVQIYTNAAVYILNWNDYSILLIDKNNVFKPASASFCTINSDDDLICRYADMHKVHKLIKILNIPPPYCRY